MESGGEALHLAGDMRPVLPAEVPGVHPFARDGLDRLGFRPAGDLARGGQHMAHQFGAGMELAGGERGRLHRQNRALGLALQLLDEMGHRFLR
ncbi:hypothetical protein B6S44_16020 [Bosea sp. Tri-44]|nr:hypothetical protein B6S44_16020 [Bosea sp. Tri-44]